MPLTDVAIRKAKPIDKPYKLADADGLYLLVSPIGGKYWRFKYYYVGKEKLIAFGTYPEVSLVEAREKCAAARKLLASNTDPNSQRKEAKRKLVYGLQNNFEAVAKEWFQTNIPKWTPDHAARLWRRVEANILPELGDRPIAEIKPLELLEVIRTVEKRGATELSHRLLHSCRAIFRYAVLTGRAEYMKPLGSATLIRQRVLQNFSVAIVISAIFRQTVRRSAVMKAMIFSVQADQKIQDLFGLDHVLT